MPYIQLNENLPGITGLLDYRLDTALPIRQLYDRLGAILQKKGYLPSEDRYAELVQ